MKTVRGMGLGTSNHSVIMCKGKLMNALRSRKEKVNWDGKIKI